MKLVIALLALGSVLLAGRATISVHVAEASTHHRKVIFIQGNNSESTCLRGHDSMIDDVKSLRDIFRDTGGLDVGGADAIGLPSDGGDFVYFSYAGSDPSTSAYCTGGVEPQYSTDDTHNNAIDGSALILDSIVARLRSEDPVVRIDIVAHSMGGAVASYWVTNVASSQDLSSIHSIITFDAVLQGLEPAKAVLSGIFSCGFIPHLGCAISSEQMNENSTVMQAIQAGHPADKVPYITIRGHNAAFDFTNGLDFVTDSKSTFPGAWLDFLGDMGSHTFLWTHPCGSCSALIDESFLVDLHDSRDTATSFSSDWGTIGNEFFIKEHARTGSAGASFSFSYIGGAITIDYSGIPFDNGSVSTSVDGVSTGTILFSPCLSSDGGLGDCSKTYTPLCSGTHTFTTDVTSGTFVLDAVETNINEPALPPCGMGPTVDPGSNPAPDTSAPLVHCFVDPPVPSSGWYNVPVVVTCGASDPQSGITSSAGCGTTTLSAETGGNVITCTATNGAGLTASASSPPIKIDLTAPTTTHSLQPPTPDGKRLWYVSDVTVTLNPSDPLLTSGEAGSGVQKTFWRLNGSGNDVWQLYTGPFVVTNESLDNKVEYYSIDNADNVEATHEFHFKLDKTPPTVGIDAGTIDGLTWDQAHLEHGFLTNSSVLNLTGTGNDNLCLWEVRAVDADSGTVLDSEQPAGANVFPPPPPTSLGYNLNAALHTGINNIDLTAEDCAGWTKSVRIQAVYVVPGPFDPRSKGFWSQAVKTKKYTNAQMSTLLSYVNVASDVWGTDTTRNRFGALTLSNYLPILNTPDSASMEQKMQAQLLADWLNMVSGRVDIKHAVNVSKITGWPIVMDDIGGNPLTFAYKVALEIEEQVQPAPASFQVNSVSKDLAEAIDVGSIYLP